MYDGMFKNKSTCIFSHKIINQFKHEMLFGNKHIINPCI